MQSNPTRNTTGLVVWLTGLPGAGKTTLAVAVQERLATLAIPSCNIDGDALRHGLCTDLGFSAADRKENVRRAGEIAKLMAQQGLVAMVSLVSPYLADRRSVRDRMPAGMFFEVFVDCPVDECRKRDPKGMYARADRGEIPQFTGVSDPYEPPPAPELHLRTHVDSLDDCTQMLTQAICNTIHQATPPSL